MDYDYIVNLVLYVIILLVLLWVIKVEVSDLECYQRAGQWCGLRIGRDDQPCRPQKTDSTKKLLKKLQTINRHDVNAIHWRRSLIVAIILAFLILFVVQGCLPSGYDWVTATILAFLALYLLTLSYQRWVVFPAIHQSDWIIQELKFRY